MGVQLDGSKRPEQNAEHKHSRVTAQSSSPSSSSLAKRTWRVGSKQGGTGANGRMQTQARARAQAQSPNKAHDKIGNKKDVGSNYHQPALLAAGDGLGER
jgi:hypothetical protein